MSKTACEDELKVVSEPEEVPLPLMEAQELCMVEGIGMEKGNSDGSSKGVEDWESDSTLPGMPTMVQLADLEAAILLHKESGNSKGIVKVQQKCWTRCGSGLGKELPALPIVPLPAQALLGFLSDQEWEDLDTWFNENIGNDGEIREEAAVVGGFDGDQPVAAPEGQWENFRAEIVEERETAVGDQAEKGKEDLFSFLDDILANLPQY
ncbi:hypothetical protein HDU80_011174 [Chytriomyces hyalinus]|nr:hypothetical protein HDU80_011174 [Chytriomyces hyalinus]